MPTKKIFLTGATGYIGGSVLSTLLKYPNKYTITALVRGHERAVQLEKLGVNPVVGTLQDLELLTKSAQESDAVINTADVFDLPAAQALVAGLKAKKNKRCVFLHNSGSDVLCISDKPMTVPFDDNNISGALPAEAHRKDVDEWIMNNTADITAAIIFPPTINGIGSGPFAKISLASQVACLAKAGVAQGKPGWIGRRERNAIWSSVNIHDLAELYRLVLDGLLENRIGSGKKDGWYFATPTEYNIFQAAEKVGSLLHKKGLVKTTEMSQFDKAFVEKYCWGEELAKLLFEMDNRCVPSRSLAIGWKPHYPNVYETMEQEIQYMIDHGHLKL